MKRQRATYFEPVIKPSPETGYLRRCFWTLLLPLLALLPAQASELEGDQLYRVSTVRAAPAAFAELLDWAAPLNKDRFYVGRHSQGDHWDLIFIIPMQTLSLKDPLQPAAALIAFREDSFAYGPPVDDLESAYLDNGFIHVEMFSALAGKKGDLLDQRRMENTYLAATGQVANMIFVGVAGSDVDVFTLGFHKDFSAFASAGPPSSEAAEQAAKAAGFKNRADISFYLRSLISGHQDTLATTID